MANRTGNRQIIVLGVIAIVLLLAALFFVFKHFFAADEPAAPPTGQPVSFPSGSPAPPPEQSPTDDRLPTSTPPVATDPATSTVATTSFANKRAASDWRDSVVVHDDNSAGSQSAGYEPSATPSTSPDPAANTTVRDPWDYEVPTVNDLLSRANRYQTYDPSEEAAIPPTDVRKSCGELDLDIDVEEWEEFLVDLDKHEAAICMGEAVAEGCNAASIDFAAPGGLAGGLYLSPRADGSCGIGISYQPQYVTLCNFADVMNSNTGREDHYFTWEERFKEDPGGQFALMFEDSSSELYVNINSYDCQLHQI